MPCNCGDRGTDHDDGQNGNEATHTCLRGNTWYDYEWQRAGRFRAAGEICCAPRKMCVYREDATKACWDVLSCLMRPACAKSLRVSAALCRRSRAPRAHDAPARRPSM